MKRVYLALLRLYPREYRTLFRAEMLSAFEQTAQERRSGGRGVLIRFVLAELFGLAVNVVPEWKAKLVRPARYLEFPNVTRQETAQQDKVIELERQIETTIKRMEEAIATHQFTKARFYSEAERRLRAKLRQQETGSI